jgi:hypothetical protein
MEDLVLITDGSRAGTFAPQAEVVNLSTSFYCSITNDGVEYGPTAHVEDVDIMCEYSSYAGEYMLSDDSNSTEDGYVHENEETLRDESGYYESPILYSRRNYYDMEQLYDGDWASTDSDCVYHGYINSSGRTGYFCDNHHDRVEDGEGQWYRNSDVAEGMGLEDEGDGVYGTPEAWTARYDDYSHPDKSDNAVIKFGIEVEKEDQDALTSIRSQELMDATGWAKESDGSLNSKGYELVSPTYDLMNLRAFKESLSNRDIARHVNADYSDRCGGHITVSHGEYTPNELFEGMTGFFPLIYGLYPKRTQQDYCKAKSKRTMGNDPDKRSSFFIKHGMLECRIFPAFRDVDNAIWRIELMQLVVNNLNMSENEVLKMLVNKNSKLHKHIMLMYKKAGRENASECLMELCARFVMYAQQYNHVNLSSTLTMIQNNNKKAA